jgi:hypothetical protein
MFNAQQLDYLYSVVAERLDQCICADFDANIADIKYLHEMQLIICSRYQELKNEQTAGN